MKAAEISRSGMDVEWQRLQIIAHNLANMQTPSNGAGEPFRPLRLVSGPRASFAGTMQASRTDSPGGARVMSVEPVPGAVRRVHEPGHPHADATGFVTYPDINQAAEMTLLLRTSRIYEANLTALSIAHQMYSRALELGRSS